MFFAYVFFGITAVNAANVDIVSSADQIFENGQAPTVASNIRITDNVGGQVSSTSDLYIVIATSTFDFRWNTSDLSVYIFGTASTKVDSNVTYISDSILKIEVLNDFSVDEYLSISSLSYTSFGLATSTKPGALKLYTNGSYTGAPMSSDTRYVTLYGTLTLAEHEMGRQTNQWINTTGTTTAVHYRYSLVPEGEGVSIGTTTFNLTGISGLTTTDLSSASLYWDISGNGVLDNGPVLDFSKRLGGIDSDTGRAMTIDSLGNMYIAGGIFVDSDLNGDGDTEDPSESTGGVYDDNDVFLTKFDHTGAHLWSKRLGGTNYDYGYALATDLNNNIYIGGQVNGLADLNGDGDTGDANEATGGVYVGNDIFLSKFNSSGTFLWSERLGGAGADYGYALSSDTNNDIYISGRVSGAADLNGDADTGDTNEATGGVYVGTDIFLSKFNSSGTFLWSERLGGAGTDYGYALSCGTNNDIYLSGSVFGTADLNGDADTGDTNEATGGVYVGTDIFLSKFNSSGTFLWSERLGGTGNDYGYALSSDTNNDIYLSGYIVNTADLNGDADTGDVSETTGGVYNNQDIFISKFNTSGTFLWSKRLGGANTDYGYALSSDTNNDIYISGSVNGTADLNGDADTGDINETAGGVYASFDIFISKFDFGGTWQWSERLGGSNLDYGYALSTDINNNVFVSGNVSGLVDLNGDADTGDTNEITGGIYGDSDIFLTKFYNPDQLLSEGYKDISGDVGIVTFATTTSYTLPATNANIILDLTASNLESPDQLFIELDSLTASGTISGIQINPTINISNSTHGVNAVNVSSNGNQSFQLGQATTSISTIRISDTLGGFITAINSIYISLATSTFNYLFDTADTVASISGTASDKVDTTITYLSDSLLKIEVYGDFTAGEYIDISGLSYVNFTSINAFQNGAIQLYTDNNYSITPSDTDDKTVTIYGTLIAQNHSFSQINNQWINGNTSTTTTHFQYSLVPEGENVFIGTTSFSLIDIRGLTGSDLTSAKLYFDYGGDGTVDQTPVFTHASRLGGSNDDRGLAVATDSLGNTYEAGSIVGNADLNSDGDTDDLNESPGIIYANEDIFLTKSDPTGKHLWSKRIGGGNIDYGYALATDVNNNIYIGGFVGGTADLNGDADTEDANEVSVGVYSGYDIFLSKFDPIGAHLWSERLGGTDSDYGYALATDANNNVYIGGYVDGTADLNGDADTGDANEVSSGVYSGYDIFLSKFNPTGVHLWSERLGGINADYGYALATDTGGNVYIGGNINSTADLNGDADTGDTNEASGGVYATGADIFFAKFDSTGIHLWSERLGGANTDYGNALATDSENNIYIGGSISSVADLNGDADTGDTNEASGGVYGSDDSFITKFNATGAHLWSERLGGTSGDVGNALATDANNNVYIGGYVDGTADLNGDADTGDANEASGGIYAVTDIFLAKFDPTGTHLWSKRLGGAGYDSASDLSTDINSNVYLGGYVDGIADLNGDADNLDLKEASGGVYSGNDIVLIRFSSDAQISNNGDISILGDSGSITLATSTTYSILKDIPTNFLLQLTASNLSSGDKLSISFDDVKAVGDQTGINISPTNNVFGATHSVASGTIISATDQYFTSGQATTTISPIKVTSSEDGNINATNDIYIVIDDSTFDFKWDTFDLNAIISGTASAKVSDTVSYISDQILKIEVIENFSSGEYITISGLSYADFGTAVVDNGALWLYTNGTYSGTPNSSDSMLVSIVGTLSIEEHAQGRQTNQWINTTGTTTAVHYRYSLVPEGEGMSVGTTTFNLTGISGLTTEDLFSASLYWDISNNGVLNTSPYLEFSNRQGGLNSDFGRAIITDSLGHTYISGYINGNADLNGDGDIVDANEVSGGIYANNDVFLSKFDSIGTHLWSERLGGASNDYGYALAVDSSNNIYLGGSVSGAADLNGDADTGDTNEATGGVYASTDMFITKFSPTGIHLWSERLGGTGVDNGYALAIDANDNIYLGGSVTGTADLRGDADTGDANEATGGVYAGVDIVLTKFDSIGTHLWAERLGGASTDNGQALATDSDNNIYIGGSVTGTADLRGDADTADANETTGGVYSGIDIFLAKFSSSGTHLWSERLGGATTDYGYALTTDSNNNIYIGGQVYQAADLNGDADTGDTNEATGGVYAGTDIFLSKFDLAGSHLWSKRLGGVGTDYCYALTTDQNNNIFLGGSVNASADLNGDADTGDLAEIPEGIYVGSDIIFIKFNPSGSQLWSERLGGTGSEIGYAMTHDSNNNIYIGGYITGTADLNGDADTVDINEVPVGVNAGIDSFLTKFINPDQLLSEGHINLSDDIGNIVFATSTNYTVPDETANIILHLTASNLEASDQLTIQLDSFIASGVVSNMFIIPAGTISNSTHGVNAVDISSNANQSFQVGQAITSISPIRIKDTLGGFITAINDIYLSIATSTFNYSYDTNDTIAFISGTAAGKADTAITYLSDSLLKIEVTNDFTAGEYIDIAGLSYANFTNLNTAQSGAIQLYTDNNYNITPNDTDDKTVVIYGNLIAQNHLLNQISNQWINGYTSTTTTHFQYSLVPEGESIFLGTTTFSLTNLSGMTNSDLSSPKLYYDYAGDAKVDQVPVFTYAKRLGGQYTDSGSAVAIDFYGNYYITGETGGNIDLNGDGDIDDLNELSGGIYANSDIFLTKFDSNGIHLWSKRLGGASQDRGSTLITDSDNYIYLGGVVNGSVDLNGDGDTVDANETAGGIYGSDDIILTKFDSSGNHVWSKRLGGTNIDQISTIAVDRDNNIYFGGNVEGTADLNGDADTGDTNESTGGIYAGSDIVFSKFNSSGTHLWSKRLGGANYDFGNALAVDLNNNIYIGGDVEGTADLNGDADTGDPNETTGGIYASNDIFLSKFASDGTYLWSERLGGALSDDGRSLVSDSIGNVYLGGYVGNNADLNGDADTGDANETSGGVYSSNDIILTKFDSSGTFLWSERLGGTSYDSGNELKIDSNNNPYILANVDGTADLNGDADIADPNETTGGVYASDDICLTKFDPTGTFLWSKRLGGAGVDGGYALAMDSYNNIYIGGVVNGTADLNSDADIQDSNEVTGGVYASFDIFLTRFSVDSQIGSNGTVDISGNSGTIIFATSTTYGIVNSVTTNFLLELTALNIISGDKMIIDLENADAVGNVSGVSITPNISVPGATHISGGGVSVVSANNQIFSVNQATTSISTIKVIDGSGGLITSTNDVYITIATSTFDYRFDTTDTLASLSGTASAKASTTVSYISDSVLKIDITSNFASNDYLDISGLSYANFLTATSAQSGALQLYPSGSYSVIASSTDSRLVAIMGGLIVSEHILGKATNQWINTTGTTTAVHYRYSLTSVGERINIGETIFNLSNINGVAEEDITDAKLYIDYTGNGVVDDVAHATLVKRIGGGSFDYGRALATDPSGNIYLIGSVTGTADLNSDGDTSDPGETTTSPYGDYDILLSKWNSSGNHLWSERIGGANWDYGNALATDQSGNIYLTGYVNDTADLNSDGDTSDPGETTTSPYGGYDIFLSKWDSSGSHLWSKRIGGASTDYGIALATDPSGNIYLTGYVTGTADLNSDGNTSDNNETSASPYGGIDIFLSKWNSSGTHLWSERIGGASTDYGYALTTDPSGNIYLTGKVNGTTDLNSDGNTSGNNETTASPYGSDDIFLSKWNHSGAHLWSERIGGASSDYGYAITTDLSGNIYLSGYVTGTADLNSDGNTSGNNETTTSPYGAYDIFLSKWNSSGTHLWSERIGGANADYGYALTTNPSGNIYLTGTVVGTADLNSDGDTSDPDETISSPYSSDDIFLSKWDSSGTHFWSLRLGGTNSDYGNALATDPSGNIYLTGTANGTADLNSDGDLADTGEYSVPPYGTTDIILIRFHDPDLQIASGSVELSGNSGNLTFSPTESYSLVPNHQNNLILDLSVANLSSYDSLDIYFDSTSATGTISNLSLVNSNDLSISHHAVNAVSLSSANNQTFQVGQATTTISTIRISDNIGGFITATDDIYLSIATTSFNYSFDTTDINASISGTATGKVNNTISYLSDSLLKVEVTSDFAVGEYIDISGLNYINFTSINTSQSGAMQLYTGNNYSVTPNDTDDKIVAVYGNIQAENQNQGQKTNQWINGQTATTSIHYQYSLIPNGEKSYISTTTFNLSGISGVTVSDLTSSKLYYDYAGNGIVDLIPTLNYAERIGGIGSDYGYALTTDPSGNIYLTGKVNGTADLNSDGDTNDSNETTASPYGNDDIFLSKWDSSGTHLWSERIGGASYDEGYALTIDPSGNIYLTGKVEGTADLNSDGDTSDPDEITASPYGGYDIFFSKWDPSGSHLWSKRIGGASFDYGYAITTDPSGNIYLTGSINGTADLNSDGNTSGNNETTASPYGGSDIFLSKWNSSGTHLWSERIGGASTDYGYALTTDPSGNIYLTGTVNGTTDLNSDGNTSGNNETTASPYDGYDIFLSKWNSSGTHLWSERIGGASTDYGYALTTDPSSNIYLTGYVRDTGDLNSDGDTDDNDETTTSPYGGDDIVLSKWDSSGTYIWSERIGGAGNDYGRALTTDPSGNIYLTGSINGTADLNSDGNTSGNNETTASPYGGSDIFLSKWNTSGTHLWSERIGGASSDSGRALTTDHSNNIYLTGNVTDIADLNGNGDLVDAEESIAYPYANSDIFLTRFSVDHQIATGSIDISGNTGTITFATSTQYELLTGTTTGFLLELTASNLEDCDQMTINWGSAEAQGAVTGIAITPSGSPTEAYHSKSTYVTISDHPLGQVTNLWQNRDYSATIMYRYRLTPPDGQSMSFSTTTIGLSEVMGIKNQDIAGLKLYLDSDSDGFPDAQIPCANASCDGRASINGQSGSFTFSSPSSYTITEATDFLVELDVDKLRQLKAALDFKGAVAIKGGFSFSGPLGAVEGYGNDGMTLGLQNLESQTCSIGVVDNSTKIRHNR